MIFLKFDIPDADSANFVKGDQHHYVYVPSSKNFEEELPLTEFYKLKTVKLSTGYE